MAPSTEPANTGEPMVRFERVSKNWGENHVLRELDFTVDKGEKISIIGPSGSGKTTILRVLMTLEFPTSGRVLVEGDELWNTDGARKSPRETKQMRQIRSRIGMVFQQFNLLGNSTVFDNVARPLRLQRRRERDTVMQMLEFVKMADHHRKHPSQLSGGEKQRVAIARALSTQPRILLCDEPTSALDSGTTEEVMAILRDVRDRFGTTIVLVSHELDVIKSSCDRAAVLERGRVAALTTVTPPPRTERFDSYAERAQEFLG